MSKVCSSRNFLALDDFLSDYEKLCFGLHLVLNELDSLQDDRQQSYLLSLAWDFSCALEQNCADLHTLQSCLSQEVDMVAD